MVYCSVGSSNRDNSDGLPLIVNNMRHVNEYLVDEYSSSKVFQTWPTLLTIMVLFNFILPHNRLLLRSPSPGVSTVRQLFYSVALGVGSKIFIQFPGIDGTMLISIALRCFPPKEHVYIYLNHVYWSSQIDVAQAFCIGCCPVIL